jgi:hypothetical protein
MNALLESHDVLPLTILRHLLSSLCHPFLSLHHICALLSAVLRRRGLYDAIDFTVRESVYKDLVLLGGGLIGMSCCGQGSFFAMVYMYPSEVDSDEGGEPMYGEGKEKEKEKEKEEEEEDVPLGPHYGSPVAAHLTHTLRTVMSIGTRPAIAAAAVTARNASVLALAPVHSYSCPLPARVAS